MTNSNEFVFDAKKNYLFELPQLGAIQVLGERGQEFLQGQLTCDLREVDHQHMRQGALCNLQGRVLALMDVIRWPGDNFQLVLPANLLSATQQALAKPAMFSRVKLNPVTEYQFFGFYLQNQDDLIPFDFKLPNTTYALASQTSYCCYSLGNHLYMLLVDNKNSANLLEQFAKSKQSRGSLGWHALQLQQKRIAIYPETRGLFLPHRLGLQLSGYLSFNKGCYMGQEIIARTHYRAKLKHELKIFTVEAEEELKYGQRLFDKDGTEVGELVDYCSMGNKLFLIAASVIFDHPTTVTIEGHQLPSKLTALD